MKYVGELGFDYPQPFVINRGNFLLTLPIAVVHQGHEALAAGQAAAVNLRCKPIVQLTQSLIDPQDQLHGIALAATPRAPDVQAENSIVVPGISYGQVDATTNGTGKVSDEIGRNGIGIGFRPIAASTGHFSN
jgi:hypothetical protein